MPAPRAAEARPQGVSELFDAVCELGDPVDPAFVREFVESTVSWGDRDEILPRSDQEALAAAIAGSRLVTYEGGGHLVHWEEPERVAADVTALVERVRPG